MAETSPKSKIMQTWVICIDDSFPPFENGDWVKKGRIYEVVDYSKNVTMDGSLCLYLKRNGVLLEAEHPYSGYNSKRFDLYAEIHLN